MNALDTLAQMAALARRDPQNVSLYRSAACAALEQEAGSAAPVVIGRAATTDSHDEAMQRLIAAAADDREHGGYAAPDPYALGIKAMQEADAARETARQPQPVVAPVTKAADDYSAPDPYRAALDAMRKEMR